MEMDVITPCIAVPVTILTRPAVMTILASVKTRNATVIAARKAKYAIRIKYVALPKFADRDSVAPSQTDADTRLSVVSALAGVSALKTHARRALRTPTVGPAVWTVRLLTHHIPFVVELQPPKRLVVVR